MAHTRTPTADLFAAIRAGNLAVIQNHVENEIKPENINDYLLTKNDAKFTLLTFAAFHDQIEIVDFLLKAPGMDLSIHSQGRHVLKVALDKRHSGTLVRLLAEKVLISPDGKKIIPITDFSVTENLHKITPRVRILFITLVAYQGVFYSREPANLVDTLNQIERIQIIAEWFLKYNNKEAAQQWLEKQAEEVIAASKFNIYNCPADKVNVLVTAMINLINTYQNQTCSMTITKRGAFTTAVLLGMLDYVAKFKAEKIDYKKYFHTAYAIANSPGFNSGEEQEMQVTFLRAYVLTHSENPQGLEIFNNERLSKHLEHLSLLQKVKDFNLTKIIFRAQQGYAAKLLTLDDINHGRDELVSNGLKLFYGVNALSGYVEAAEKFKAAAPLFKKAENAKKLEVLILSLMAQHQIILMQNDRLYTINVHLERALTLLSDILPLYHQDLTLEHEIELFALQFELIKFAPRNHDKIILLNQLLKFLIKISQFTVYSKKDLVDYIFNQIIKNGILKEEECVLQVIKMLKVCLHQASSAFNWKQFYNKWDAIMHAMDTHPVANIQLKFKLVLAKLETSPLYFQMASPYLNYHEIIYGEAYKCMEMLPALATQASTHVDLQPYSWIYYNYANLQTIEIERDKFYFKAINLRSTAALIALMRLPSAKKYEVYIQRGLQDAIAAKDVSLITIINNYLSRPEQQHYSHKLQERSQRALRVSNRNSYARSELNTDVVAAPKTHIEMTVLGRPHGFFNAAIPPLNSVVSETNFFHAPGRD